MGPSVWISLGGLIFAAAAFWRSGRVRVLDMRIRVRKESADLRVTLNDLLKQVPMRVQSRERVAAAMGFALSGAMQEFKAGAESHTAQIKDMLAQLDSLGPIRTFTRYKSLEDKEVALHGIRRRTQQLSDKIATIAREDDASREHIRKAAIDRVHRS